MTLRDRVHQTSPHVSGKAYLAEHGRGSIAQRIAESDCHWADGGNEDSPAGTSSMETLDTWKGH
jgi:hypothetical protein